MKMRKQKMGECPFLLMKDNPEDCSTYMGYSCYLNPNKGLFSFLNTKEAKRNRASGRLKKWMH